MPDRDEGKGDDEDDEIILRVLGELESMLYESCSVDGEDWNTAESKSAVSFRDELEEFEAAACRDFLDDNNNDDDAYSLEQTMHHKKYCALVDRHCECYLRSEGYDPPTLAAKLRDATGIWQREGASEILEILLGTTDFRLFARDMATKAKLRYQPRV